MKKRPTQAPISLNVEVVHGDIRDIKAPTVVAGHYRGVPPVRAVGALDQALEFWISKAVKRGMIGGGLGEVFLIPNAHKSLPRTPSSSRAWASTGASIGKTLSFCSPMSPMRSPR